MLILFLASFLLLLVLSWLAGFFFAGSVSGRMARWFLMPGIIVHEISHAGACLVTGAPIQSINLFEPSGGSVTHGQPRIPIIGQIIVSFAPVLGAVAVLYFAGYFLLPGLMKLPAVAFINEPSGWLIQLKDFFVSLNYADWKTWLFLYLVLSISVTMTPSGQDFQNSFWGLIIVAVIFILIYRFFPDPINPYLQKGLIILSFAVIMAMMGAVISAIFYFLSKFLGRRYV
jgi:hypothetical protein